MKIRERQLPTIIIFFFGITGYREHRHIAKAADSFQERDDPITHPITSLPKSVTSSRRVSIKALESSLRGKPNTPVTWLSTLLSRFGKTEKPAPQKILTTKRAREPRQLHPRWP